MKKRQILYLAGGLLVILALNLLGNFVYHRFDFTSDKRYTLSDDTKDLIDGIKEPLIIKVYLEGEFPAEFKRIQTETKQHLEELSSRNKMIKFKFINPLTKTTELSRKRAAAEQIIRAGGRTGISGDHIPLGSCGIQKQI